MAGGRAGDPITQRKQGCPSKKVAAAGGPNESAAAKVQEGGEGYGNGGGGSEGAMMQWELGAALGAQ